MRRLIQIIMSNLMAVSLTVAAMPTQSYVWAHDEGPAHEHTQEPQTQKPTAYTYTTPENCSLSLLTRRSLQLYDQESQDLSLSQAQAIYAETNIVKQLGERWLEIGEKVSIDKALVEDFAKKSQTLKEEQIAAWQFYANQASFDVSYIAPDSSPETATSKQQSSDLATNESQEKPKSTDPTPKSSSPAWYLWLIVGAALAGMYLMMDRPRKK